MTRVTKQQHLIWFGVTVAAVVATAVIWVVLATNVASDLLSRSVTRQISRQADNFVSGLREAQGRQADFALTHDPDDRQAYDKGIEQMLDSLQVLKGMAVNRPEMNAELQELQHSIPTRASWSEEIQASHLRRDRVTRVVQSINDREAAILKTKPQVEDIAASTRTMPIVDAVLSLGFIFSCYLVLRRELSRRKKVEAELAQYFSVSLDLLAVANIDGWFLRMNPVCEEILGYTPEEMCSRPAVEFVHPDDIQPTIDAITAQSQGKSILSFENRYRCKDGSYRWLSWKSVPNGKITYGVARDVTEMKESQATLLRERESLRHALEEKAKAEAAAVAASRMKSTFLANMSHEIRTPINGIIGMTMMLQETELTAVQKEYQTDILNSASSLLAIINDILDLSKIESGKLEVEMAGFDLQKMLGDVSKMVTFAAQQKKLVFRVVMPLDLPKLFISDAGRLRQILLNLLSNAVKFTAVGEIELRIEEERLTERRSRLRFVIQDHGIGIPAAAIGKLFQPFTQVDSSTSRRFGGTGLGLSICQRLVELLGGTIGVDSVEGQGSTFWFAVELNRPATGVPLAPVKAAPATQKADVGSRVLIAEDNIINQKIAVNLLRRFGYDSDVAVNGLEVLAALASKHYDAVLMDCQMPVMDGYEATAKIRLMELQRGLARADGIAIIALTANAINGDRERCLEAGMDDYLTKPLEPETVARALKKWTQLRQGAA